MVSFFRQFMLEQEQKFKLEQLLTMEENIVSENNMKHRSSVYDSMVKSPNRAMLRATGMTDDSFEKPIVGYLNLG